VTESDGERFRWFWRGTVPDTLVPLCRKRPVSRFPPGGPPGGVVVESPSSSTGSPTVVRFFPWRWGVRLGELLGVFFCYSVLVLGILGRPPYPTRWAPLLFFFAPCVSLPRPPVAVLFFTKFRLCVQFRTSFQGVGTGTCSWKDLTYPFGVPMAGEPLRLPAVCR